MNRVVFFPYLLSRWSGYEHIISLISRDLSIAVFVTAREETTLRRIVENGNYESRLRITPLMAQNNKEYPINKLRNLAIRNVRTSHFWLTDMDMWPSGTYSHFKLIVARLREALMALPRDQLQRTDLAVIVPAFELRKAPASLAFSEVAAS